jgi:hypothetical protein
MELLKALEILLKVADVAQGKGIFTLEDACVVKYSRFGSEKTFGKFRNN